MDTNVLCIDPNLAIFLKDNELKHYNLVYGQGPATSTLTYITNMLLTRTSDGQLIPPAYPTTVELQTPVESLDYDGNFFWSVQASNNTPIYPGWVIRKWQVIENQYAVGCIQTKVNPGFYTANCLAVEWYKFPMRDPTDATRNYITIDSSYSYILERMKPGFKVKVGPNTHNDYFWGTVSSVHPHPNNPYQNPYWWVIEFNENLNTSYVAGEDVFFDAGIHVFLSDPAGYMAVLHPVDLTVMEEHRGGAYSNITACAFTSVKGVPSINVGMRTPALFYIRDMVVYCKAVDDLGGNAISTQIIPTNYEQDGNTFFEVYELRIRNDHPDSPSNYPQHYLLQKKYREGGRDGTVGEWSTYNYVLQRLHSNTASMIVDVQPQFLTRSGIASCSCQILDDYGFPVPGISIVWSHNCGSKATFLDATTSGTDANGYVYNRLFVTQDLSFPAYVTATTNSL